MTSIHETAASPLKSNLYELKMNLKKKKLLLSFLMKYVRKLKAVLDLKIFSDLFWRKCYRQSMPHLSKKLNWKSCFLFYPCSPFKLTFASISIFIISLFLPQNICIKIPRKKANRYFDAVHFIWFLTFFSFSFFFFFWFYFLFNYFFWSVLGKNEPSRSLWRLKNWIIHWTDLRKSYSSPFSTSQFSTETNGPIYCLYDCTFIGSNLSAFFPSVSYVIKYKKTRFNLC